MLEYVDISRHLPNEVTIDGRPQPIIFEGNLGFCHKCGRSDHTVTTCNVPMPVPAGRSQTNQRRKSSFVNSNSNLNFNPKLKIVPKVQNQKRAISTRPNIVATRDTAHSLPTKDNRPSKLTRYTDKGKQLSSRWIFSSVTNAQEETTEVTTGQNTRAQREFLTGSTSQVYLTNSPSQDAASKSNGSHRQPTHQAVDHNPSTSTFSPPLSQLAIVPYKPKSPINTSLAISNSLHHFESPISQSFLDPSPATPFSSSTPTSPIPLILSPVC